MRGRGATERRREIDVNKPRRSLRPTHGRLPRVRLGRRSARPRGFSPRFVRRRRGRFRGRRRGERVLLAVARPGPFLGRGSSGPSGPAPRLARVPGGAAHGSKGLSGQRRRRGRRGGHLGEAGLRVVHFLVFLLSLVLLWQPFVRSGFDLLVCDLRSLPDKRGNFLSPATLRAQPSRPGEASGRLAAAIVALRGKKPNSVLGKVQQT